MTAGSPILVEPAFPFREDLMQLKAVLLDFYGTLVEEDTGTVEQISRAIAGAAPVPAGCGQIGRDWHQRFVALCSEAHGVDFRTQREIEAESLEATLAAYGVAIGPHSLLEQLFRYWQRPEVFDDGAWFVANCPWPICIVSNIDNQDIEAAMSGAGWYFDHVVTSESCRSYKPRPEMFLSGLEKLKCSPQEALHVGDSLRADVAGAQRLGIRAAWVNRRQRPLPAGVETPTFVVSNLWQLCGSGGVLG
jgi:2-haloalkanoic acid dehalogenase type II